MDWKERFPLTLAATADAEAVASATGLVTSVGMGAFGPSSRVWQFEPGLAAELEPVGIWLTCSGFQIRFRDAEPFRMLFLGDGVWRGQAPDPLVPDLFSTRFETEDEESIRLLDTGDHLIALAYKSREGRREIALVLASSARSREAVLAEVKEVLDNQEILETAWQNLLDTRSAWADGLTDTEDVDETLMALEHLVGVTRLMPETDHAQMYEEDAALATQIIPSVLEAMAPAGMSRVSKVLKGMLASRRENEYWPVIAQGIQRLPFSPGTEDLKHEIAVFCEKGVRELLNGWTPQSETLPVWPDPAKSFTPEIAGGDLVLFDFPALLIAEMEACAGLHGNPECFAQERTRLQQQLAEQFWSPKRKAYLDQTAEGGQAKRMTAATLLPLLWQSLPQDQVRTLAALPGEEAMKAQIGLRQWELRDRDPTPPPVRLETQHILLPVLDRLKEEHAAPLSAALHRAQTAEEPSRLSVLVSALRLRLLPFAEKVNPHLENVPKWVLYMEKHRTGIIGSAATLLFLAPVIGVLWIASGPRLSPLEEHLVVGQAQTELSLERYPEAEQLYTTVLKRGASSRFAHYHLQRGNIRYRMEQFENAITDYEEAIQQDPEGLLHQARWNLAQSYRSLGRTEDARQAFQTYIDEYGEELTDQADRARLALQLLTP